MLAKVIKMIIPKLVSHPIHEFLINITSRWWPLWRLYLLVLFGDTLKGVSQIGGDLAVFNFQGHNIVAPRKSIHIFREIFIEEVYEKRFKASGVVVDIGAFVGMFSVKTALCAKEVIAIEPHPAIFEMLKSNCANLPNVKLVNKAISSNARIVRLYLSRNEYGNSIINKTQRYIEVEAITLDSLLDKPVDFIKIDCEGAELDILKGAIRTLSYPGTKLVIAAYHCLANGELELPYIVSYLEEKGYKIYTENEYVYAEKK